MKTLLSILGSTTLVISGAIPVINSTINHKNIINTTLKQDITEEIELNYNRLEYILWNDPDLNKFTPEELIEVMITALKSLDDIFDSEYFYKYADLINQVNQKYKLVFSEIYYKPDQNLFDHISQTLNDLRLMFIKKQNINLETNNQLYKYQVLVNKEAKQFSKVFNAYYSYLNNQIMNNNLNIMELNKDIEVITTKLKYNGELSEIYSQLLATNNYSKMLFETYESMFLGSKNFIDTAYGSAEWHARNYGHAAWPIYGIFFVKNFKEAMNNLTIGMRTYADIFAENDVEITQAMQEYEYKLNGYVDEVLDNVSQPEIGKTVIKKMNLTGRISKYYYGPNKIGLIIQASLTEYFVKKLFDFIEAVFAPFFAAKQLSDDFFKNVKPNYDLINEHMDEMLEELEITKSELYAVNSEIIDEISKLNSEAKQLSKELNKKTELLLKLEEENAKKAEEKVELDKIFLETIPTMSIGNHLYKNIENNFISERDYNDFDSLLNELIAISTERQKMYNNIVSIINDEEFQNIFTLKNNSIDLGIKKFITFFE